MATEMLVMAMTRMLSGVCTAGFTCERDPVSHLCWLRPVKEFDTLLLGDLTDDQGRVIQMDDVVALHTRKHRPEPPHVEDWVTDFIYHRPRVLRRLEGERRADFLAQHLDQSPQDVLSPRPTRSLCLIRPDKVWARFELDTYSGKYQARMGFTLVGTSHRRANAPRGVPVTDLKWRALGRRWLAERGGTLRLSEDALRQWPGAEQIYLSLGLSRDYAGKPWLLIVGVHLVPDYSAEIDYNEL